MREPFSSDYKENTIKENNTKETIQNTHDARASEFDILEKELFDLMVSTFGVKENSDDFKCVIEFIHTGGAAEKLENFKSYLFYKEETKQQYRKTARAYIENDSKQEWTNRKLRGTGRSMLTNFNTKKYDISEFHVPSETSRSAVVEAEDVRTGHFIDDQFTELYEMCSQTCSWNLAEQNEWRIALSQKSIEDAADILVTKINAKRIPSMTIQNPFGKYDTVVK